MTTTEGRGALGGSAFWTHSCVECAAVGAFLHSVVVQHSGFLPVCRPPQFWQICGSNKVEVHVTANGPVKINYSNLSLWDTKMYFPAIYSALVLLFYILCDIFSLLIWSPDFYWSHFQVLLRLWLRRWISGWDKCPWVRCWTHICPPDVSIGCMKRFERLEKRYIYKCKSIYHFSMSRMLLLALIDLITYQWVGCVLIIFHILPQCFKWIPPLRIRLIDEDSSETLKNIYYTYTVKHDLRVKSSFWIKHNLNNCLQNMTSSEKTGAWDHIIEKEVESDADDCHKGQRYSWKFDRFLCYLL